MPITPQVSKPARPVQPPASISSYTSCRTRPGRLRRQLWMDTCCRRVVDLNRHLLVEEVRRGDRLDARDVSGYWLPVLLRSVAAGDGNRRLSTPLTRYYTEAGTPPGRWLGSGLHALGNGEIRQGDVVGEQQLALLLGTGSDPVTGEPLGRAFPVHESKADEYGSDAGPSARRAVAGYDLTFSVPKSVSALWGVADEAPKP